MAAPKQLADGIFILPGIVNTYLLDGPGGLTLIDTGFPGGDTKILRGVAALGRKPGDLRHIVLTHAHPDHIGGLAALVKATGARTYMHALDVPVAETGGPFRPLTPAPGLLAGLMFRLFVRPGARVAPARIDQTVAEGDILPVVGPLEVIHIPGHCAGQIALLWRERRALFAGDACVNMLGLGPPVGYEDRAAGENSQRKLAGLDFDIACFGHGNPIRANAAEAFRKRWG